MVDHSNDIVNSCFRCRGRGTVGGCTGPVKQCPTCRGKKQVNYGPSRAGGKMPKRWQPLSEVGKRYISIDKANPSGDTYVVSVSDGALSVDVHKGVRSYAEETGKTLEKILHQVAMHYRHQAMEEVAGMLREKAMTSYSNVIQGDLRVAADQILDKVRKEQE